MDINKYQDAVKESAKHVDAGSNGIKEAIYLSLLLSGKTGKLSDNFSSIINNEDVDPENIVKTLGEILWVMTSLCNNINISLETLADYNIKKNKKTQDDQKIIQPA